MKIRFPTSFRFGATTAAYATEGAWKAAGKGESIWDRFTHTPQRTPAGDTGDLACNAFHTLADDVASLSALHATSYRFSIAWSRIQPDGRGSPLADGLDHYSRVVDTLLEAGMGALPTLYHWDLPQALQDRGGWAQRDTASRFADYAHYVGRYLGDRVESWMLLAEPNTFCHNGYGTGLHAPGIADADSHLRATHTANLAQADGLRALRAAHSKLRIGPALGLVPYEPAQDSEADCEATKRFDRFQHEWFLSPALEGVYPDVFPTELPLERMGVRHDDMERCRADFDFIGVTVRPALRVEAADDPLGLGARVEIAPKEAVAPAILQGSPLQDRLTRLAKEVPNLPIELTCEMPCDTQVPNHAGEVHDTDREAVLRDTLVAVSESIAAGAKVQSYHAGNLLDAFEWEAGYRERRGLVFVDFPTGQRTLKQSGHWFRRVAAEKGFDT